MTTEKSASDGAVVERPITEIGQRDRAQDEGWIRAFLHGVVKSYSVKA